MSGSCWVCVLCGSLYGEPVECGLRDEMQQGLEHKMQLLDRSYQVVI